MFKWIERIFGKYKLPFVTKIDGSELADYVLVGHLMDMVDGKITAQEFVGASRHPTMRIIKAWAMLAEVADGGATTFTVVINNGGTAMTDVLTFTQGTETIGDHKKFTMVSNQDVVTASTAITITTAGTTTTLGEVIVHIQFENTG